MDPITIGLILTAIAGLASANQQKVAGKVQQKKMKNQAKNAEREARERELQRKQKINKVLASQIAGMGASGITGEGSPTQIAISNITEASLGDFAANATQSGVQADLQAAGSNARKMGNLKRLQR